MTFYHYQLITLCHKIYRWSISSGYTSTIQRGTTAVCNYAKCFIIISTLLKIKLTYEGIQIMTIAFRCQVFSIHPNNRFNNYPLVVLCYTYIYINSRKLSQMPSLV